MADDSEDSASITETDYDLDASSHDDLASSESLLGARLLSLPLNPKALLRLDNGEVSMGLANLLGMEPSSPSIAPNGQPVPVVLGPFLVNDIEKLVLRQMLHAKDCLLLAQDRWKPLRELFPNALAEESTADVTVTLTESLMSHSESSISKSGIELESVEELPQGRERSETSKSDPQPPPQTHESTQQSLDLETDEEEEKPLGRKIPSAPNPPVGPPPESLRKTVSPAPTPRPILRKPSPSSRTSWLGAGLVSLALGIGAYLGVQRKGRDHSSVAESLPAGQKPVLGAAEAASRAARESDWPEAIRPRRLEDLYAEEAPLVRKIRPLLIAYESGSTALSAADERTLLEVASPGSASFEARRLAANQLAILYLANSRIEQAKRTLAPMMESADSDPVTLINASLLELGNGEYTQAWDYATTALRVATPAEAWIAHAVVGLVSGYRGMAEQAETGFRNALRASPANPFVYGLFLRFLVDRPGSREKISRVLEEALWSDPDRLLDSPIRAPIAGHVLLAFAFEGFLKAAESPEGKLSEGKKAFVRWLEARYRRNPISQPLSSVTQALSTELDSQSQVLHAYLLQEQGQLDRAAEVLSRVIPSLGSGPSSVGSWPWTFAGDVQQARGNVSQAQLLYSNALNRNPQDVSAVLGLALIFRERGDFMQSQQKFSEAKALESLFIPAFLRVSRFDWHRGYRAQ